MSTNDSLGERALSDLPGERRKRAWALQQEVAESGCEMKRLEEPTPEANGPCADPLPLEGGATGEGWMSLGWSAPASLTAEAAGNQPTGPGIYRIFRPGAGSLLYVGETTSLRRRLRSHARREWGPGAQVSVKPLPEDMPTYQRKEIESDLLGGHFEQTGAPPEHQYGALPSSERTG
jgi:hypothetical protein